jgi:lysophospholipase L1-like esterase
MRYPAIPALSLSKGLLLAALLAGSAASALAQTAAAPVAPDPHFAIPATNDGLPGSGPVRRYDWFQRLWQERRSKWATQVQQDQRAIVFLGDSITQGWHDDLDGSFPGLKVANRGISGDTTRGVLIRLQEDVISLNPRAVVLLIGTNDLEEGAEPWVVATNIRLILDELKRANPAMPVVLCQVMPSSPQKKRPAYLIRRINQLILELTLDQPQVTVVDTWKLYAGPDNNATADLFPDLLHPNNLGYAKWANAIRPVLATLGFVERENDEFTIENDFVALFNGHDLTGWGYRPTAAEEIKSAQGWQAGSIDAATWPIVKEAVRFDRLKASPDGRFVAKAGRLIVTTPPGGRIIQQLWTTQEFPKNFVLRLQFRATPNADSGVYVRGPQLQCRDYLLAGPYTKLQHYRAQEWNDIEITVKDGVARCTCNGEVLEEAMKVPETGPIGLEGDRGQMEYRRIRMMELPAQ